MCEGEPGQKQAPHLPDLYHEVWKLANALKSLVFEKGDRVAIYMGMVPELAVAMSGCARIGATHSQSSVASRRSA